MGLVVLPMDCRCLLTSSSMETFPSCAVAAETLIITATKKRIGLASLIGFSLSLEPESIHTYFAAAAKLPAVTIVSFAGSMYF